MIRKRILIIAALTLSIFFADLPHNRVAEAQRGGGRRCNPEFPSCMDPNIFVACWPLPTTLPVVDPSGVLVSFGFRAGTSSCGAKTCYYLFACECGYPRGVEVCQAAEGAQCGSAAASD